MTCSCRLGAAAMISGRSGACLLGNVNLGRLAAKTEVEWADRYLGSVRQRVFHFDLELDSIEPGPIAAAKVHETAAFGA